MAVNGWRWLELARMAINGCKWQEMSGMAGITGNGWKWPDWIQGCHNCFRPVPLFATVWQVSRWKNPALPLLHGLWELHCCSNIYLDHVLATTKIQGMSKGEEGGKNQFKVINRFSSPEPSKQLCCRSIFICPVFLHFEMAGIDCNGQKLLEMAGSGWNGWKLLEMAEHGWKWPDMDGNGCNWFKLVVNGLLWL